ncbi:MAG TPA: class I SAM-dependent methyltransferase [Solirubrobacterales bacterium]|nr:class I SAM-dependent methyltransferase [Solirubrobacterales bacterium]
MEAPEPTLERPDAPVFGESFNSRSMLRIYDAMVYRFSEPLFWRCSVKRFLDLYDDNVSARHLDIGVATGYLLDHCRFPVADPQITLMDLNPEPLAFAAHRLQRYAPRIQRANVLDDWKLPDRSFDSIAMFNLLHCVPGTLKEKAVAFEHARAALAPGGTLFGATIVHGGVKHTRRSRGLLKLLNRRGVFDNLGDDLDDLEAGLARSFGAWEVQVEGVTALFKAGGEAR